MRTFTKHLPMANKNKFRNRSFGRQVAFQVLYQEELNPGSIENFSDDFIHVELHQLCSQINMSDEEEAQDEIQAIQEEIVNEDVDTSHPVSYDELLELVAFVKQLVEGTREHLQEIDKVIAETSRNWTIARMAVTDRSIIRMAVFEMKWIKTPRQIVINEAIELAKKFGTDSSIAFVNGILDTIGRKHI